MSKYKYRYDIDYFNLIDNAEKAYWLGFLYADGSVTEIKRKNSVNSMTLDISLKQDDVGHLEKFNCALQSNIPIKTRTVKYNDKQYQACRLQVNSTKLCKDLCNLGCTPRKTYNLTFPNDDIVPKEFKRDFIRGFFDGDGCICVTQNNTHITLTLTGMQPMLELISNYLISEGVLRVNPTYHQDKRSQACSVYYYGKSACKEILDYLYKNASIYLDRKYKKYVDFYKDFNEETDFRGVHYDSHNNVFVANILINGKTVSSRHHNYEDAVMARKELEVKKMNISSLN